MINQEQTQTQTHDQAEPYTVQAEHEAKNDALHHRAKEKVLALAVGVAAAGIGNEVVSQTSPDKVEPKLAVGGAAIALTGGLIAKAHQKANRKIRNS